MKKYYLEDGSKILIDDEKPLGSGGEGSVFKLAKNPNILVKIYTDRALERMPEIEHKIKAMVSKKPGLLDYNGLTIIAWPSYVVYDDHKKFVGYLMKRVQAKNQLSHVITPGLQKNKFPNLTWYDRLVISINLAKVMSYIHKNDTVVGDINTSDFFVYPGFEIGVVDTDSFQFTAQNRLYKCVVFTPDYTPPEVIEEKKRSSIEVKRIPNHDNYGLAILVFQVLMMGVHPFSARIKGVMGFDGNAINYNMEHEIFPYSTGNNNIIPPKNAMPFSFFPKNIQDLFTRAFEKNSENHTRPTAEEWVTGLRTIKDNIKKCKKDKTHFYPAHFQKCPICAREASKDYDYLLEYFKSISRKYVKYETSDKPIIVDENHVYNETIGSKVYALKGSKKLAVFFNPKMLDKYRLDTRIEYIRKENYYPKIPRYFSAPIDLIVEQGKTIGYTTNEMPVLYRLQNFLKNNRLGKLKITDKVKMVVAEKIAKMYSILEKHNLYVEINQIYIDKNLNPMIPDLSFMSSFDDTIKQMVFQREEYLPQEYYYYLKYKKYLDDIEAVLEKEREIKRKEVEEQRRKDLELIRSPFDPKPVKVKEKEKEAKIEISPSVMKEEDFVFEKSLGSISEMEHKVQGPVIPLKFESYNPRKRQTIRFALAVIIHTILHEGHPFKGTVSHSEKPISYFVEKNSYLHKEFTPNADISDQTKLIELFPKYYQNAMKKALYVQYPLKINRTSPSEWRKVIKRMIFESKKCKTSEFHYYHVSITKCPYCALPDQSEHKTVRKFILEYKKGLVHYMLNANMIFNYSIVSLLIIALIYYVNLNQIHQLSDLVILINFEEKLNIIKAFIHYDQIIDFFENAYAYLVRLYRMIFGGGSA